MTLTLTENEAWMWLAIWMIGTALGSLASDSPGWYWLMGFGHGIAFLSFLLWCLGYRR